MWQAFSKMLGTTGDEKAWRLPAFTEAKAGRKGAYLTTGHCRYEVTKEEVE